MSQIVLNVDAVSKSYGKVNALKALSLSVARGEFVALLGLNGAGKSTLFQLLSGLFVADSGKIQINEQDICANPIPCLAQLGIVFQQPTLDLSMSVRANLLFHGRLHGMGSLLNQRITEELDRVGLLEQLHVNCGKLSGGNRRRVELARALLHRPSILLMDEATVGLDPASRRMLLDYVHQLCATQGLGVLWTTHLVEEAERADRVIILHQGRKLLEGAPSLLLTQTGEKTLAEAFLKLTVG